MTAHVLSLADLENAGNLAGLRTLMIGWQSGARLSAKARANIASWTNDGGLLIGFGVGGFDDAFGVKTESVSENSSLAGMD